MGKERAQPDLLGGGHRGSYRSKHFLVPRPFDASTSIENLTLSRHSRKLLLVH